MAIPSAQNASVAALSIFDNTILADTNGFAPRALRGVMANMGQGLALQFQFNPDSIDFEKTNNWDIDYITGYNSPIFTWVSGKEKTIKFNLFFDSTAGSASLGPITSRSVPGVFIAPPGSIKTVQGQIAVMDSFQAPSVPSAISLGLDSVQLPPPDCYFILGVRFWRTVVMRAPRKEILYDHLLRPLRVTYEVELAVKETGNIQAMELIERKFLSLTESSIGDLETNLSVI